MMHENEGQQIVKAPSLHFVVFFMLWNGWCKWWR